MGDDGGKLFADFLNVNRTLKILSLYKCQFHQDAVKQIGYALANNTTLENIFVFSDGVIHMQDNDNKTPILHRWSQSARQSVEPSVSSINSLEFQSSDNPVSLVAKRELYAPTFYQAVENNDINLLRVFLRGEVHVNQLNQFGISPLGLASRFGHVNLVTELIKNKANVNIDDEDEFFPLLHACEGNYIETAKHLLKAKADINKAAKSTPLAISCQYGYLELTKYLLKEKADINKTLKTGDTALYLGCKWGQVEVVRTLIEAKADIYQKRLEIAVDFIGNEKNPWGFSFGSSKEFLRINGVEVDKQAWRHNVRPGYLIITHNKIRIQEDNIKNIVKKLGDGDPCSLTFLHSEHECCLKVAKKLDIVDILERAKSSMDKSS